MSWKQNFAVGGGAVVAADLLGSRLPAAINVGGLPVGKIAAAVGGAYAGAYAVGNRIGIVGAAIRAAAALAAAELATCYVPVHFGFAGLDAVRIAAGAVGVFGAAKVGI